MEYIDYNIGKKGGNAFATATDTGLTGETVLRAYV
jgi:hypothetical protein